MKYFTLFVSIMFGLTTIAWGSGSNRNEHGHDRDRDHGNSHKHRDHHVPTPIIVKPNPISIPTTPTTPTTPTAPVNNININNKSKSKSRSDDDDSKDLLVGLLLGAIGLSVVWHFNKPKDSKEETVKFGVNIRSVEGDL